MSARSGDGTELRLYGEHIHLNSRSEEDSRRACAASKSRPQSALYASTLNIPDHKRRPFSAGTVPHSPTVLSFLRRAQTDRPDLQTTRHQQGYSRDSPSIPGTVDSSILFNKLLRDPIKNNHQHSPTSRDYTDYRSKHIFGCDNMSEISSVDTCASLGTKIKNRAQSFNFDSDSQNMNTVSGSSIKLKKSRPSSLHVNDKLYEYSLTKKSIGVENGNSTDSPPSMKLSIVVPHHKDDNTSSGVSSSSEVQGFSYNQRSATPHRKAASEENDMNNEDLNTRQHKLSRSKKSPQISINWFPESFSRNKKESTEKPEDDVGQENYFQFPVPKTEDLTGRVSFGKKAFMSQNSYDDEDESYLLDSHDKFNAQLSLVEEESSQESDFSPKQAGSAVVNLAPTNDENITVYRKQSSNFYDYKFEKRPSFGTEENYKNIDRFNAKIEHNTDGVGEEFKAANIEKLSTTFMQTPEEDEIERKFKTLEDKYRNETSLLDDVKSNSYGYKYEPVTKSGLHHSWTSLENVVSKENDTEFVNETNKYKETRKLTEEASKYIYGEEGPNIQNFEESTYKYASSSLGGTDNALRKSTAKENIRYPKTPINHLDEDNESIANENTGHKHADKHSARIKTIPDIVINYSSENPKNPENTDMKTDPLINETTLGNENNDKSDHLPTPDFSKSDTMPEFYDDNSQVYPEYLEKTESKVYTSKVIEDYKKEIASINTYHDLTLKDIRNQWDSNLKSSTPNKPSEESPTSQTHITDDDLIEEIRISDYENKEHTRHRHSTEKNTEVSTSGDISRFLDEYNKYKLRDNKTHDTNTFDKMAKDFMNNTDGQKEPDIKIKPKRKIKKKERGSTSKYRNYNSNESTDSKYTETKTTKSENRRLTKSAPSTKKDSTNRVKFRAQKITLSKSTTNINKTMYIDTDRDIISWMASKTHGPFDESSSTGHPDASTPDLYKDNSSHHMHQPYAPQENNNDIEKKIEPIIKTKPSLISEGSETAEAFNENKSLKKSTTKETAKAHSKPKEVSFETDTLANGDDVWGDQVDGNELSDLLEDDEMVSNIYSVLKEIEHNSTSMAGGDSAVRNPSNEENQIGSAEYKDIVNFLDKVESTANEELSALSHTQPPFSLKVEELMEMSKGELAHRAVAGALAAGKASAAAVRLRTALISAANRAASRIRSEKLAARQKANIAAQHSSQAIARHQKFIEQLINEKKTLAERIEQLVGAVSGAEARSSRAARSAAERLQLELRNQRQRLTQVHQRDKNVWLKQHTQKIKDMTVKGLEGELREMEDKHMSQLTALQRNAEAQLNAEKEKHSKEMKIFKENAARQLEDQLDRERLLASERMELKRAEWESALAAAAERAGTEGREAARAARREGEMWREQQEALLEERRRAVERQFEERRAELMEEMSRLRETICKEFEKYKEDYVKKQTEVMKEKEAEIRALSRRERDREIEKAIDTMEMEAQEGRKEMQETLRRVKVKYETDMKTLEESEQTAMQRCKEARELLRDAQEQCALNQITMTQLDGKLRQADELKMQTVSEMEMSIRSVEMKGREEMEEMRAQMIHIQQQHKDEMHQLYAKVKVAVAKKDDALSAARRDAITLRDRCLRLEARLAT